MTYPLLKWSHCGGGAHVDFETAVKFEDCILLLHGNNMENTDHQECCKLTILMLIENALPRWNVALNDTPSKIFWLSYSYPMLAWKVAVEKFIISTLIENSGCDQLELSQGRERKSIKMSEITPSNKKLFTTTFIGSECLILWARFGVDSFY